MHFQHQKLRLPFFKSAIIAAIAVAGCAKIPSDDGGGGGAVVRVEVNGGIADIVPGPEFSIPIGGDTLLYIDAGVNPNTRITGIWVDGGKLCCAEDDIVRERSVSLVGVKGNVTIIVELGTTDSVIPTVEIVSPPEPPPGDFATGIPKCSFGVIEYRLNKAMANGYVKWSKKENSDGWEDLDSLQFVRIPGDITKRTHSTGEWSYASPDGYLSEGLQKFSLDKSPVPGKQLPKGTVAVPNTYVFEVQFADSLGNKSEKATRTLWVYDEIGSCR